MLNAGNAVEIHGVELNPTTRKPDRWVRIEPTPSYVVQCVAARHGNEFYVLGLDAAASQFVLERWSWPRVLGGYYSERPIGSAPHGAPLRTPDTYIAIEGDVYIAPSSRAPAPMMARSETLRFAADSDVFRMVVDPDARYIVMHSRDLGSGVFRLVQQPLLTGASPTTLVVQTSAPELAKSLTAVIGQHGRHGRFILFHGGAGLETVWLLDALNDGVLESWGVQDTGQYFVDRPLHQWQEWW